MEMVEKKEKNSLVFQVKGRLDTTTSTEVDKKLMEHISSGVKNIILDFSMLDYISSAGIRVLVHCHKNMEKQGGKIVLADLPKQIENVLYITGFLPYFKVFENVEKATESLK